MIAPGRINLQTEVFDALGRFLAKNLHALLHVDVLVMTGFSLGRGREDRLRQLRPELQSSRQFDSANALGFLIFLPAGAGQITAHNAFDRQRLRFAHNHGTTSELLAKRPQLPGKRIEVGVNKVIVDLPKPVEPENRELIEDRAFFRDGIG